ncbi:Protein of unknown function DUF2582 [Methanosalsum zhilinae DSM 4017]|uniref:Winged helix-turn-helix domain-containing protein n=1 Tax=Methanosalsum zhilinae (strain DSM 4017 / NBRC 107636 / OCM 62 / WeN5) TaxID=679901 RepID=F7XNH6_METZD|nr:winged helix-turn-helix domain-containing protein [Methanosalsum zhilinae]AEH61233.1 Protein of unknown function DUF2582 [Methanosalsum zhilinae DSM 4017]
MENDYCIDIGLAAGAVYSELENGDRNLTQLRKHIIDNGYDANTFLMALGWLAREDKVCIIKQNNKWSICLK